MKRMKACILNFPVPKRKTIKMDEELEHIDFPLRTITTKKRDGKLK